MCLHSLYAQIILCIRNGLGSCAQVALLTDLCFLTKSEQKRRKHILAIVLQIIEIKNYKANCFWQNSFLPRTEYQNVVSIFPLACHKFHSGWRLWSWFRIWTRRVQVTVTATKVVRFINVLVILLKNFT